MKIYKKSGTNVLAELDKNDIQRYRLNIKSLSFDDSGTKQFLNDVALMTGFDFGIKARLYIDCFFVSEDCAFIAVTLVSILRRYRIRQKTQHIACRLNKPEQLYCICEKLSVFSDCDGSLLFDGITYTLVLRCKSNNYKSLEKTLAAFGRPIKLESELEKALLFEHNLLICNGFIGKLLS